MARTNVLDLESLKNLRALDSGGTGLVETLIEMFETGIDLQIEELQRAVDLGHLDAVSRIAHVLKSTSANLGAQAFSEICAEMEETVLRRDRATAGSALTVLMAELVEILPPTRAQLRRHRLGRAAG